jgi:hypothetical protein
MLTKSQIENMIALFEIEYSQGGLTDSGKLYLMGKIYGLKLALGVDV